MARRAGGFVEITCTDRSQLRKWTNEEFERCVRTLHVAARQVELGAMTRTRFAELEQVCGLRHNPHGLLCDADLRCIVHPEVMRYDWVHTMLQGGVLNSEIEAIMRLAGIPRSELQTFLKDESWVYPHQSTQKSRQLHRVFDERREVERNEYAVKASCSELLGIYGMLRFYIGLRLTGLPDCEAALGSFSSLCHVLDLILAAKRKTVNVTQAADRLEAATISFLAKHISAHGTSEVKPKHHWLTDVGEQIRIDNMVVDAFVVERIHLRVKQVAENIKNTSDFEVSVLSSLLTTHLRALSERSVGDSLLGRAAMVPGCPRARVADKMRVYGVEFRVGDVVAFGDQVGVLEACATEDEELLAFVRPFAKTSDILDHVAHYRLEEHLQLWAASIIVHALAWRKRPDGTWLVIRR